MFTMMETMNIIKTKKPMQIEADDQAADSKSQSGTPGVRRSARLEKMRQEQSKSASGVFHKHTMYFLCIFHVKLALFV